MRRVQLNLPEPSKESYLVKSLPHPAQHRGSLKNNNMEKRVLIFAAAQLASIVAAACLVDWKIFLAVFLMLFANNLGYENNQPKR